MSNPNWPSFPGLQNMTQDADGRPQLLDLIPGRQRGTPLNTLFFNPLIRAVCDLQDGLGLAVTGHGYSDGDSAVLNIWRNNHGGLSVNVADGSVAMIPSADDLSQLVASRHTGKSTDMLITDIGFDSVAGVFFFKDADGTFRQLQPAGDYAVRDDLEAYQPRGDYLSSSALDGFVTGKGHSAGDRNPTNIWGNSQGGVSVNFSDGSELDLPGSSASDSMNCAVSLIGINRSGTPWMNNGATNETVYLLRQDEADNFLRRTGGDLTGEITLYGNTVGDNLYGRTLYSKADHGPIDAAFQLVGTQDNPVISLHGTDKDHGWHQWAFNLGSGQVVSPNGGVLPEVLGMGTGRVVMQCFYVHVSSNVSQVFYPQAFSTTEGLTVQITPVSDGGAGSGGEIDTPYVSGPHSTQNPSTASYFWVDTSEGGRNNGFFVTAIGRM